MKRAIEQETLQTMVETRGGAGVSRAARRRGLAPGAAARQQVAADPLATRADPVLALADGSGTVCEGVGIKTLTVEL